MRESVMDAPADARETARTRARYDRLAPIYDQMERIIEWALAPGRKRLWSLVPSGQVLEVGVGTGKNFSYHAAGTEVTGIDLSERMLVEARRRAGRLGHSIDLRAMDAQQMAFAQDSFEAAVATFVFCSVPDPVRGLRELGRVVQPGGRILLLEHVRLDRPGVAGAVMDLLDPLVVRVMGSHINRRTVENVRRAGLEIERVEDLGAGGLLKLIVARAPTVRA